MSQKLSLLGCAFLLAISNVAAAEIPDGVTELTPASILFNRQGNAFFAADGIAEAHYAELSQVYASRNFEKLTMKVYELKDPPADPFTHVRARARFLNFHNDRVVFPFEDLQPGKDRPDNVMPSAVSSVGIRDEQLELIFNRHSGAESFFDHAGYHRGLGVPEKTLLSEGEYFALAREHVRGLVGEGGEDVLPYKRRFYRMVATDGITTEEKVTQVAVAFNRIVDNRYAAIGSGAKIAVHMAPDGRLVGYESTRRPVRATVKVLKGQDILSPDAALQIVQKRLEDRGINFADFQVTRKEFGYLERGRNSIQRYLIPHYAFFFEPSSQDVLGRKIVETIPATTDQETLAMSQQYIEAEVAREALLMQYAGESDEK